MSTGIEVVVDGVPATALPGETVGALLLRLGVRSWRAAPGAPPHALFCGIGACFDCTLTVDGRGHTRACVTAVRPRMSVETHRENAR